jgi:nicotinate-nucleotide adenylyltransferase
MTVGLLGGSFDPPHLGHVNITQQALKRFSLDRVWWLVSPGNPLKRHSPAPMKTRMAACRAIMADPRVTITDIETQLGTISTFDTLAALHRRYRGVRFVWLMGADNLAQFHKWHKWRSIINTTPIGVLARPGDRLSAQLSPSARLYGKYRLTDQASHLLPNTPAPAWCFINIPMNDASSYAIRTTVNRERN